MTLEEVNKLSDGKIKVKVAELCGWRRWRPNKASAYCAWEHDKLGTGVVTDYIPDYPNDLNACHEFLSDKSLGFKNAFLSLLSEVVGNGYAVSWKDQERRFGTYFQWSLLNATAKQRCKAFLMVMT